LNDRATDAVKAHNSRPHGFDFMNLPITVPAATYRLQMNARMNLVRARELLAYLDELGIDTPYLSPIFQAVAESTHGYDIVEHGTLDGQLGTEADFAAFAASARARGMGVILDIVPNHMGIGDPRNRWWQDVLTHGQCSEYANYFDIDWYPPKAALHGKVLLAILGEQFGKVLEAQELRLVYEERRFAIRYFEHILPTDPKSWEAILINARDRLIRNEQWKVIQHEELNAIINALQKLPPNIQFDPEAIQRRRVGSAECQQRLAALLIASPEFRQGISSTLDEFNGAPDQPRSFDLMEVFLDQQPYRLCYWRVATDEINYRRFFDVDALAAIRVEEPAVFAAIHELPLRFLRRGWITGLRVDHADGLYDPRRYLTQLAESADSDDRPGGDDPAAVRPYLVIEKILAPDEALPDDWPIAGTTGYDYLNWLNGVFVDRAGWGSLRQVYSRFTGENQQFSHVLADCKRTILSTSLSSELYVLSQQLARIAEQDRWSRDFTRPSLHRALREVVVSFPVYRTYIHPQTTIVHEVDHRRIQDAIRVAKRRNPAMSAAFFDFISAVLLLEDPVGLTDERVHERRQFVLKFQQVTGPVTAKGLEDTAFYRYYPLLSCNEVGGNPAYPPLTLEQFHTRQRTQLAEHPNSMLATGTHDTKRGEDVRARLNVLSEIPAEWEAALERWYELNAAARGDDENVTVPCKNEEYFLYQTLVGTLPPADDSPANWEAYVARIIAYAEKGLREAKAHTSWLNQNLEYEQGVTRFLTQILADSQTPFAQELRRFVDSIAAAGYVNGLAQALIKICSPGVPDFYQGTEFWDFHLVDPDNRHAVDYESRQRALTAMNQEANEDLAELARATLSAWPSERVKLFTIWRALRFRRDQRALFEGDYLPLQIHGPRHEQVLAFARNAGAEWALCVTPRLALEAVRGIAEPVKRAAANVLAWTPGEWWRGTSLVLPEHASGRWRHVLTGRIWKATTNQSGRQELYLGDVFSDYPVALLTAE